MRKIYIFDYLCSLFYLFCFTNKITNDENGRNISSFKTRLNSNKNSKKKAYYLFYDLFQIPRQINRDQ